MTTATKAKASNDTASRYEIAKVKISSCVTDPRVQRTQLNQTKLNKMIAEFDERALGVLIVSMRANNQVIVLDGWHRSEACKVVPEAPQEVDAKIFYGLSLEDEALLFRLYNTRTAVNIVDRFRAEAIEGQAAAVRITEIVAKYGMKVSMTEFAAVATAVRICQHPNGFELFEQALDVVDKAWTLSRGSTDGRIIEGVAEFLYHYAEEADPLVLAKRLAEHEGGYKKILETAKAFHAARRGRAAIAVLEVLTPIYNKGKAERNRLPGYQR